MVRERRKEGGILKRRQGSKFKDYVFFTVNAVEWRLEQIQVEESRDGEMWPVRLPCL